MVASLRRWLGALFVVFAAAGSPVHAAPLEPLTIETAGGTRSFEVEVMRTNAERMRGLMFRRDLPPERGMLFEFESGEPIQMWMKNTYLPLDMVFSRKGRVVAIAKDTEPLSEQIISSGEPADQVVELNAGTAVRLGIAVGDRLVFPVKR